MPVVASGVANGEALLGLSRRACVEGWGSAPELRFPRCGHLTSLGLPRRGGPSLLVGAQWLVRQGPALVVRHEGGVASALPEASGSVPTEGGPPASPPAPASLELVRHSARACRILRSTSTSATTWCTSPAEVAAHPRSKVGTISSCSTLASSARSTGSS